MNHPGLCTVCVEVLKEDLQVARCGHVFHADCIHSWLAVKRSCPLCKRKVTKNTLTKLYLEPEQICQYILKNECGDIPSSQQISSTGGDDKIQLEQIHLLKSKNHALKKERDGSLIRIKELSSEVRSLVEWQAAAKSKLTTAESQRASLTMENGRARVELYELKKDYRRMKELENTYATIQEFLKNDMSVDDVLQRRPTTSVNELQATLQWFTEEYKNLTKSTQKLEADLMNKISAVQESRADVSKELTRIRLERREWKKKAREYQIKNLGNAQKRKELEKELKQVNSQQQLNSQHSSIRDGANATQMTASETQIQTPAKTQMQAPAKTQIKTPAKPQAQIMVPETPDPVVSVPKAGQKSTDVVSKKRIRWEYEEPRVEQIDPRKKIKTLFTTMDNMEKRGQSFDEFDNSFSSELELERERENSYLETEMVKRKEQKEAACTSSSSRIANPFKVILKGEGNAPVIKPKKRHNLAPRLLRKMPEGKARPRLGAHSRYYNPAAIPKKKSSHKTSWKAARNTKKLTKFFKKQ